MVSVINKVVMYCLLFFLGNLKLGMLVVLLDVEGRVEIWKIEFGFM